MNGYQPKSNSVQPPSPKKPTPTPHKENYGVSLEVLARQCQERGNRLEVMNGKVYEVQRKLIGEVEN